MMGLTVSQVQDIELGKVRAPAALLAGVVKRFADVDARWLLTGQVGESGAIGEVIPEPEADPKRRDVFYCGECDQVIRWGAPRCPGCGSLLRWPATPEDLMVMRADEEESEGTKPDSDRL
jgi:hypothetical protein